MPPLWEQGGDGNLYFWLLGYDNNYRDYLYCGVDNRDLVGKRRSYRDFDKDMRVTGHLQGTGGYISLILSSQLWGIEI